MPRDDGGRLPSVGDEMPKRRERTLLQRAVTRPAFWAAAALLAGTAILRLAWPAAFLGIHDPALIREASAAGMVAVGMTMVLIAGGIDLSAGALIAVAGSVASLVVHAGDAWWVAAICGLAASAAFGLANGLLIALAALPPFLVTLGSFAIAGSAAAILQAHSTPTGLPLPHPLWLLGVTAGILALVLWTTVWGRHLFAFGGNAQAAKANGVPVKRLTVEAYALSAALAGLAGLVIAAPAAEASGAGETLRAVAAAVIGGASFAGGVGGAAGAVVGALLLVALHHVLPLAGLDANWLGVVVGICIVAAVMAARRRAV